MSLICSFIIATIIGISLTYLCVRYGKHVASMQGNSSSISYTLDEYNFAKGKAFLFFGSLNQIETNNNTMFAICTGDDDVAISEIKIQSTSKFISWNWYEGIEVDTETGTSVYEVQRNANINSTSNCKVIINPGYTTSGQLFDIDIDIYGVSVSSGDSHIREAIINKPYALKRNTNYGIKINNRDSGNRNIELIINLYKM